MQTISLIEPKCVFSMYSKAERPLTHRLLDSQEVSDANEAD